MASNHSPDTKAVTKISGNYAYRSFPRNGNNAYNIIERFFADIQSYDFSKSIDRNKFHEMAEEIKDMDCQLVGLYKSIADSCGAEATDKIYQMRFDALGKSMAFLMITLGEFYRTLDEIEKPKKEEDGE